MSYKTNQLLAPRVGQFDFKRLFQMKIEQCSSIIPLKSCKIVAEPKILTLGYLTFGVVLGPRNVDNLTNKQLLDGNKLHLPLI